MAKQSFWLTTAQSPGEAGFSLVELMVALVFTGLLMTGMAQVFKSSLSTFYTSGEILSSARRNRASIDLLYDDLNSAALYISSITAPPGDILPANPAFYILPNRLVTGATSEDPGFNASSNNADELFFYLDQPLPFEGRITVTSRSADEAVSGLAADGKYTIDCGDPGYASALSKALDYVDGQTPKRGLALIFKDSWESLYFTKANSSIVGTAVNVEATADPNTQFTGLGSAGGVPKQKHIVGSRVLFYIPAQMVRYSIKIKTLDPQKPAGIPCLIRDQGNYSGTAFVPDTTLETIITENVSGFKVYLSTDSGKTWAGRGQTYTGTAGWDSVATGIRAELDIQLSLAGGTVDGKTTGKAGRQDVLTTRGTEDWFRKIPTLVRLDITTRTASKRTEYSSSPTTAAYKDLVQSLVIVPRHSGLPLN